jgi:Lrp/AsnC family leucine-responsive transcriptional regulator
VVDVVHLIGPYDYLPHAYTKDPSSLDALVSRLKTEGGIGRTQTRLALRTPKR